MDRERLKEIQQTDLTESKVNEDFLDWLKTKGPTYLLFVLILFCAVSFWQYFKQKGVAKQDDAWFALETNIRPADLLRVKTEYDGVGSVAELALRRSADIYLQTVLAGVAMEDLLTPTPDPTPLTEDERTTALDNAEDMFKQLFERVKDDPARRLFKIQSLFGQAAIAECRGDQATASGFYDQAAAAAGEFYPGLADQAEARKESLAELPESFALTTRDALPEDSIVDPLFRDLIVIPEEDDTVAEISSDPDAPDDADDGSGDGEE